MTQDETPVPMTREQILELEFKVVRNTLVELMKNLRRYHSGATVTDQFLSSLDNMGRVYVGALKELDEKRNELTPRIIL